MLSEESVNQLWIDKTNLMKPTELCQKYNISRATLFRELKKKGNLPPSRKLTTEDIMNIISLWNNNKSQSEIAKKYDVTQSLISMIVKRKVHQHITNNTYIKGDTKDTATVSVTYNPNS